MAGESKEILELSKHLIPVFNEIRNAARTLGEASEKLSNSGLDKYTEHLKKALKTAELANDLDLEHIKDAKSLQKALSKLEDQYDALLKLEKEAARIAKASLGDAKVTAKAEKEALEAARASIAAKYEEHDISLDMVDALKKGVPLIRQEAEVRAKQILSTDKLTKVHEGLTESIKKQAAGFASLGTSVALLKKAFFTSYDQMNRLTSRGMLGAFTTLNVLAPKLLISAQDLEEILNKNRDIINTMGGGTKGIEAFGAELSAVRGELKYLGKEATKAAARFVEMSKKSGLTPKDGQLYRKNMDASIKQFKEFAGLFGDSYEDYANLMEQIQEDEQVRKRLNVLSKSQLQLELEEIRQRTANLKLMGLSNTQIVEFNKQLQNIVNPRKNDFAERAVQSISFKQSINEMAKLLQKGGTPEDAQILQDLQQNQAAIQKIADLNQRGRQKELADFMHDEEGARAARAYSKAAARTDLSDQFDRATRNYLMDKAGGLGAIMDKYGGDLATAQAQQRDQSQNPELEQLKKNAADLAAANSKTAEALAAMTTAVEGVKSLLENPFVLAAAGAVAGLVSLALAARKAALALAAIRGGNGPGGMDIPDGKGGKGKGGKGGKGRIGGKIGGALGLAALGYGAYEAWDTVNESQKAQDAGDISENEANKQNGSAVGGLAGAGAGAAVGAGFGSVFPGVGTVIGGLVGGAVGYFGGSAAGEKIGGMFGSETKQKKPEPGSRSSSGKVTEESASGQNNISSIVSTAPGSMIVKRPDGTTVKLTGTRAWRNNNPGNLEYNDYTRGLGAIGTDGRFAIFPDLKTGMDAKGKMLFSGKNYKDLTLSSAIARYAPPSENNTGLYQANVLAAVGGENKPMSQYTPEQQSKIMAAMAKQEGFRAGTTQLIDPTGQIAKQTAGAGTGTAAAPQVPAAAAAAVATGDGVSELKKQTSLLAQLVTNTMGNGRVSTKPDSYMADPAVVMGGVAG